MLPVINVWSIAAFHNNVVSDKVLSTALHNNGVKINVLPIAAFYHNVVSDECIINSSLS